MALVAPDLRPRGPAELYDAALHLCLRGGTALPALSLAGALLPAISGLWLVHLAMHGKPFVLAAALFTLGLMLRSVFAGAAALAGEAALEGLPLAPGEALRRAFRRAPSLMSAGAVLFLLGWIVIPSTFWLGLALWSPLYGAHALVARAEAGPFGMGRVCRARLGREPHFLVRVLHGLALLVTLVNVHTGIAVALYLGRALLALDVTFLERFCSVDNAFYDFFVLALALAALEPVKNALGLLLLVDARVRSEGLDLMAATERLAARHLKSAALVLVALLPLLASGAAQAQAESDTALRLEALAADLGLEEEPEVRKGLEAAARLEGPEAAALRRFVVRTEEALDGEEADFALLESRLMQALDQARGLAGPAAAGLDPREAAREILARPEFDSPEGRASLGEERESLFVRFMRWLLSRSEEDKEAPETRPCGWQDRPKPAAGVGGGTFEVLTPILVGLAIVAVLWLIVALLRRDWRRRPEAAEGVGEGGAGPAADSDVLSALARPPEGWASEADRLAARGEFRQAVRALYLAVLSALHRRGSIDYDPTRSNWDYVRSFRGEGEQRPAFRALTLRFDFVWYGRRGADAEGFAHARGLARPFLEPEVRADA